MLPRHPRAPRRALGGDTHTWLRQNVAGSVGTSRAGVLLQHENIVTIQNLITTHEGAFEVDGVKYDPNANLPDESGAMVVKNGWVSGFGEAKKKWKQIEAGQDRKSVV